MKKLNFCDHDLAFYSPIITINMSTSSLGFYLYKETKNRKHVGLHYSVLTAFLENFI